VSEAFIMRSRLTASFRIERPKPNPVLTLLILVPAIGVVAAIVLEIEFLSRSSGFSAVNAPVIIVARWIFAPLLVAFAGLAVWSAIGEIRGRPRRYLAVGPEGLLVRGLFGTKHRRWEEIGQFRTRVIPGRSQTVWITCLPPPGSRARPTRFFFSEFVRIGMFTDLGTACEAITSWFEAIAFAYTKGSRSGTLPPPPDQFIGRIVDLVPGAVAMEIPTVAG